MAVGGNNDRSINSSIRCPINVRTTRRQLSRDCLYHISLSRVEHEGRVRKAVVHSKVGLGGPEKLVSEDELAVREFGYRRHARAPIVRVIRGIIYDFSPIDQIRGHLVPDNPSIESEFGEMRDGTYTSFCPWSGSLWSE